MTCGPRTGSPSRTLGHRPAGGTPPMLARRSPVLLVLVLAAVATAPGVSAQTAAAPVIEAPRQVTGGPNPVRLFDIPALAVDPRDPNTVVMAIGDARNGG